MDIYPSYTYHISWTEHDKHYYGVRMANQCQPEDDLWIHYYTSSNIVKSFREEYGEPDIIRVDKTFVTREEAADYETQFLTEQNSVKSDKWLNGCNFPYFVDQRGKKNHMYGKTHSEETKRKISEAAQNMSDETRRKLSEAKKGENHPMYGKTHSKETRRKMSEALKGKTHTEETIALMKKPKNQDKKNSQYGTMWITDGNQSVKIKKCDCIPTGWRKGRVMSNAA